MEHQTRRVIMNHMDTWVIHGFLKDASSLGLRVYGIGRASTQGLALRCKVHSGTGFGRIDVSGDVAVYTYESC